jgi:hypothetical protein
MPSGIILRSASPGATEEDIKKVLSGAGYEVDEKEAAPAPAKEIEEPKRDAFKSEEEFEAAHVEWQDGQETKEDDEEKEGVKAAAKPSRKQRAIDRATKELKAEVAELRKKLEAKEPEKKAAPAGEEKRPARGEFPDTAEGQSQYEDALLAWGTKKALGEEKVKSAEKANKERFEQNLVSYGAQVEEAKDKYEDWDEVVNQNIFIGREAQLAILELENGAEVIYYLGRHPVAAAKLGELSPVAAIMEVGRLSTRLKTGTPSPGETNGTKKAKAVIPAPVKHVDSAAHSTEQTFAEIAAKPNYPGKAKDLRRALGR